MPNSKSSLHRKVPSYLGQLQCPLGAYPVAEVESPNDVVESRSDIIAIRSSRLLMSKPGAQVSAIIEMRTKARYRAKTLPSCTATISIGCTGLKLR